MAVKPYDPRLDEDDEDQGVRRGFPNWEPFSVEVKEIVATIVPGAGNHGPIAAAFLAAGEYMQEHDHPMNIEFTVFGMNFTAHSENGEPVNQ